MTNPLKRDELPDGAVLLVIERHEDGIGNRFLRGILLDIDGETKAGSVDWVGETDNIDDLVHAAQVQRPGTEFWFPVEVGMAIRYLQSGELSVLEAATAAIGIRPFGNEPPDWKDGTNEGCLDLIEKIKAALGTDEDGDALVQVARDAHLAEQELAAIRRKEDCDV